MGHHHHHHHHDMGAVSAPMDHHAAAAAAAANAGVPLDVGPADDPAHAPIPGLEPVDHPLPDDSPQAGHAAHMRPGNDLFKTACASGGKTITFGVYLTAPSLWIDKCCKDLVAAVGAY